MDALDVIANRVLALIGCLVALLGLYLFAVHTEVGQRIDDAPILDLRIRKGVRRNAVKLAIASSRPWLAVG